ncbi:MAG: alkaline phosphatase [Thermoguttaceae bacterium]
MLKFRLILLCSSCAIFCFICSFAEAQNETAKNVILMIGDGMGFPCDEAGTFYRFGESGKQVYHTFPVHLGCSTFSVQKGTKLASDPKSIKSGGYNSDIFWENLEGGVQGIGDNVVTDSAAASTAFSSGVKTSNGRIGMSDDKKNLKLLSEIAVQTGRKVGTVTTVPISHATPAGFAAHDPARGDLGTIFLQMSAETSPLSVIIGAGHPLYEKGIRNPTGKSNFETVGGESTWNKLVTGKYNDFIVIETKNGFDNLAGIDKTNSSAEIPSKVIGIPRSFGSVPPIDGEVKPDENNSDLSKQKRVPSLDSAFGKVNPDELPTLSTMTLGALRVLSHNNEKGFVLLIEGGAIDFANHAQNAEKSVLEHVGFAKAIETVIDWIETNSSWNETLLIVTADHETGQMWGPGTYTDRNNDGIYNKANALTPAEPYSGFKPIQNHGKGFLPSVQYASKSHSNALVPLWAKGIGADRFLKKIIGKDPIYGDYIDNTDIFDVMKSVLK